MGKSSFINSLFKPAVRSGRDAAVPATEIVGLRLWWKALAVLSAAWVLIFYLFSETAFSLLDQWKQSETYSHCFIVFPITIYLIWQKRKEIITLAPRPNCLGLPIIAMIGIGWLLARLGAVLVVEQFALVAMMQVVVFTIVGWPVTHGLLYPLGFLFFAVPFGDEWVRPLQNYTALFTVKALQLTGVPVFRDGWMIAIPSHTWEIVEACSGIRYLIGFVVLGYLFSYWTYRSWKRRLYFMVACCFGGIVANGFRTYGTVMLAHWVGLDHLIQGWIFFSLVVFLMFWLGLRWQELTPVEYKGQVTAKESVPAQIDACPWRAMAFTALGAVVLLGLAPLAEQKVFLPQRTFASSTISEPKVTQPWRALDEHEMNWNPHFLGADAEFLKSYMSDGKRVQVYIAYYSGNQRQGAELISVVNDLIPEKHWRPVSAGYAQAVIDGKAVSVNQSVLRSNDGTRLLWSWYWVGGNLTSNPIFGKILELKSLLLGQQKGSAMIALGIDAQGGDLREAAKTLQKFLGHASLVQPLGKL